MAAGNAGRPVAGRDRVSQPEPDLDGLAGKVGHNFGHPDILRRAVTHASAEPRAWNAYERLEFLGDRVLALVVAEQLLDRFPHEREGAIAKRHVSLVRGETLRSEEHTSELQSLMRNSYAVYCLKKKKNTN